MKMPKTAGGWVGLAFKVFGAVAVAAPGIAATAEVVKSKQWNQFPVAIVAHYTGYNLNSHTLDTGELTASVASIAGGIALAKIGTIVSRMLR